MARPADLDMRLRVDAHRPTERAVCYGSQVPLTQRRAVILALLDSLAQGWTAEELAYELYGDACG